MLKSLVVDNLFGRFNYTVDFSKLDVTIITGPNGFGKSTLLKIVNAVSKGNIGYFFELDFDCITLDFENREKVSIKKNASGLCVNGIEVTATDFNHHFEKIGYKMPNVRQVEPDVWFDRRTLEIFTEEQLLEKYTEFISTQQNVGKPFSKLSKLENLVKKMRESSGDVQFIPEQRLIETRRRRHEEDTVVDVIDELPKKLAKEIANVSQRYSEVANKLDSSYPQRLFNAQEGLSGEENYYELLEDANRKFKKLSRYNLIDINLIDKEQKYKEQYSTALKIYFDDFSEKYQVFENLVGKLDLFTKIINEHLMFKEIRISRENGFEITDTEHEKNVIPLKKLSSGEKQEVVLFYNLIFETQRDLLLLIDEPEISLHIAWQKNFLNDLLEVVKTRNIKVIVATHSPQIINNHWDIQVDLGELYGQ